MFRLKESLATESMLHSVRQRGIMLQWFTSKPAQTVPAARINPSSIRLATPDGDRMNAGQTLGFYGIEDGDQLDVMIEQTGGY